MKQPSSLRVSTGFVVALFIIALGVASVGAAPLNQATFPASEDITLDGLLPNTNRNAFPLQLQNSSGAGGETTSRVVLLKFNVGANPLSGLSVAKARLDMATIGLPCGAAASNVTVNVYGTTLSNWSETAATWNNVVSGVPAANIRQATLLRASDSPMPSTGHAYWTDASNGNLAQYIENARVNNGGVVSLWLEILIPSGTTNVTMENRVLVGQTNSCVGGGLAPSLQIASADQPLAVTMSTFEASDRSVVNWPLYLGLAALVALSVGLFLYRRRAAAR